MAGEDNYREPKDAKYDSFSKGLMETRNELVGLFTKHSLKKGKSLEFVGLGITIYPEKKN